MQDTRNGQICIAESDHAGRPPAVQLGGSVRLAQAECRSRSVSPLRREGALSVTALYRIGAVGNRAGQAGDRTQIMHGEPPSWLPDTRLCRENRRGRLEHVPGVLLCGQQLPGEVAGVRHEVCWLGRLAGERLFRPWRSR